MWSDYIYSKHGIIPVLALEISSMPHYSLSVLLYLFCNKTLPLYYKHCSFPLKNHLVLLNPFKNATKSIKTEVLNKDKSTDEQYIQ